MSLSPRSSAPASARSSSSRAGPRLPKQRPGRAGQPSGSKLARVRQIADRIPKAYKQPNGEQLTVTQASQLAVPPSAATCRSRRSSSVPTRLAATRRRATSMPTAARTRFRTGSAAWDRRALRDQPGDLRRALHAAQPSGPRALALHVQVRRATSTLWSCSCRRRRRARATARCSSVGATSPTSSAGRSLTFFPRAHRARAALTRIELGNIARLTRPRTYAFEFSAAGDGKPILILTPPTVGS